MSVSSVGAPALLLDSDTDGTVGSDFRSRFDLLPGDVTNDWSVLTHDSITVRPAVGTSVFNPGSGYPNQYSMWTESTAARGSMRSTLRRSGGE